MATHTHALAGSRLAADFDGLLADYRNYLVNERGLVDVTVNGYLQIARWFLEDRCGAGPAHLGDLGPPDVSCYLASQRGRGLSPRTINEHVVRLRAFLRFCYLKRLISAPLAQAAPWLARSRAESLPKILDPRTGELLLSSCDRETLRGSRDLAVLTLLARLGLRVSEVARLQVNDIGWRTGEIVIRGKGASTDRLPLPTDVGEVLASYLQRRGPGPWHEVFWTVLSPRGALSVTAVRAVVRRACERVGIPPVAPHRFRHGLASELLRRGASLQEIGQLLRHHHLQTTAVYAKVDLSSLVSVAQPWPGATR